MEFRNLRVEDYPAFLKLYNSSIPEGDRREFENEKHLDNYIKMKGGKFNAFCAVDGDLYLAFLSYWTFEGYTYIEHLGVSPDSKDKNIARLMLNHLFKEVSPNVLTLVKESDNPDDTKILDILEKNEFSVRKEFNFNRPSYLQGENPVPVLLLTHGDVNLHNIDSIKAMLQEVFNINEGA